MARNSVSRTALGAATCRLIEQYEPAETRLFDDAVAKELVGAPIRALLRLPVMRSLTIQQTDGVAPGIFGAQICRTRYIDDAVRAAFAQGMAQLVILGAGLDTRPYRLPGMEGVRVFEVDLPAAQAAKQKRLQKYLGRLPEHVTFIPIDFERQSLEVVFARTAFDPSAPALFLWEGVTQYLTDAAVQRTLTFVGSCAPGSRLVFTYVLKSILEHRSNLPGAEHMLAAMAQYAPWTFGLEPAGLAEFLRPFGMRLIADVGNAEYQAQYLKPLGRKLVVFEGERVAQAVVG